MTNSLLDRVLTRLAPTGRQGRRAFLLNVLSIWVVVMVPGLLIKEIIFSINPNASDDSLNILAGTLSTLGFLLTGLQVVKRLHDFGRPFEIWFFLMPLAHWKEWLGLFISSGDEVPNDYGP